MDEHKSVRQNWKEMDNRQRVGYFKEYFLIPTIAVLFFGGFLIATLWQTLHREPEIVMHAFIFSDLLDDTGKAEAQMALAEQLDTVPDAIFFDDGHEDSDVGGMQLATLLSMEDIDVVICKKEMFEKLSGEGTFVPVTEYLTAEEIAACEPYIAVAAGYREPENIGDSEDAWDGYGKGEEETYGLKISDCPAYAAISLTGKEFYIGVVANSKHAQGAVCCVRYFMGDMADE